MDIRLWHFNFNQRLNKLSNSSKIDIPPARIDEIFYDATYQWLKNNAPTGESDQAQIDKLSTLIVTEVAGIPSSDDYDGTYVFLVQDFTEPYYRLLKCNVKTECQRKIPLTLVQQDDFENIIHDPYRGPSKKWGRLIGTQELSSDGQAILVHTNNVLVPVTLHPTYIKHPVLPVIGGYNDIDGNPRTPQNTDLPEHVHTEVIDEAVRIAALLLQDPAYELYRQK